MAKHLILALCVALAGCAFKGGQAPAEDGGGRLWRAAPAAARVYPSTAYQRAGDETFLDARIELLDQMGDSIKGTGTFRLELFAPAPGRAAEAGRDPGQRLYAWNVPLETLDQQRRFYDRITRTYQFRLRLDDPAHATADALLRATFLPASPRRQRLVAEAVVGRR